MGRGGEVTDSSGAGWRAGRGWWGGCWDGMGEGWRGKQGRGMDGKLVHGDVRLGGWV